MIGNVFVVNESNSLKPVQGASALVKTISSTAITVATDTDLGPLGSNLKITTGVVRVQVKAQPVWVNYHGVTTPSATNAIELAAGTIVDLSREVWVNSVWLRATGTDGSIVAQQLAR